jgi:hypothetical protein
MTLLAASLAHAKCKAGCEGSAVSCGNGCAVDSAQLDGAYPGSITFYGAAPSCANCAATLDGHSNPAMMELTADGKLVIHPQPSSPKPASK